MPPPPRPKMSFGIRFVAINIYNICKGHLGFGGVGGGEASNNKLKDTSFIFPMTNVTISGVFRTHTQKEYGKVLEMKSGLNGTQYKNVKRGVGVESARFQDIVNGESLETYFGSYYAYSTAKLHQNIRLIARTPFVRCLSVIAIVIVPRFEPLEHCFPALPRMTVPFTFTNS